VLNDNVGSDTFALFRENVWLKVLKSIVIDALNKIFLLDNSI
jgi:hypothetical protein